MEERFAADYEQIKPWRVMFCVTAYSMMSMYVLLGLGCLVGIGVFAWQNYGWLLREQNLNYSEGWTTEQKTALDRYAAQLRTEYHLLFDYNDYISYSDGIATDIWCEVSCMRRASRLDEQLRRFTSCPAAQRKDLLQQKDVTDYNLAFHAADLGNYEAVYALVEQDYPAVTQRNKYGETILGIVLSNMRSRPINEVLGMADWLLARGSRPEHTAAFMGLCGMADDLGATVDWLLANGLSTTRDPESYKTLMRDEGQSSPLPLLPFHELMHHDDGMALIEKLVREGKIDINTRSADLTYLQYELHTEINADRLAGLLALGADPNLLPLSVDDDRANDSYNHLTPLAYLLLFLSEHEDDTDDSAKSAVACVRLLLLSGAEAHPLPAEWLSPNLRQQVESLYRELNLPIHFLPQDPSA